MARTASASLVTSLSHCVGRAIRHAGYVYAEADRVEISDASDTAVSATVFEDREYRVLLTRSPEKLIASCTCSRARHAVCKHIWATIIESDEIGYLRGTSGQVPHLLEIQETEYADEVDRDYHNEWAEDPAEPRVIRFRPEPKPQEQQRVAPPRTPPPAPTPAWKLQLNAIRNRLQPTRQSRSGQENWPMGREITYWVDVQGLQIHSEVSVVIRVRDRKLNGDWSKPKSVRISREQIARLPDAADREILGCLAGARSQHYMYDYYGYSDVSERYTIPVAIGAQLLRRMCDTGRCYALLGDEELQPLEWDGAGAWELWLSVVPSRSNKHFRVVPLLQRGTERIEVAPPVRGLSDGLVIIGNRVATLDQREVKGWQKQFDTLTALQVPAAEAIELIAELYAMPGCPRLDLPETMRFEELRLAPRPCLKVFAPASHGHSDLNASLHFDYSGNLIANGDTRPVVTSLEPRRAICRDYAAESASYAELRRLGFRPASRWNSHDAPLEIKGKQLPRALRELLDSGWHVEAEGKLYLRPGNVEVSISSGVDWFELHGSVSYGATKATLPTLLAALKKGQDIVQLDDGTFGMLPDEWLQKYGVLAGLGTAHGGHLRFTRSQVGLLDALLASQPEANCDEVFTRARDRLKRFDGIKPLDAPAGFVGQLRAYQCDGLGWMEFLRDFGLGGCLADDMGLGKTVQVLALLESRRAHRGACSPVSAGDTAAAKDIAEVPVPAERNASSTARCTSLVVMPRSLVFNWKQEAARFAPQLRLLDHTGGERTKGNEHFEDYDVVLTTYGTLRRDVLDFKDAEFDYVILDEAQAVKNANTESAKAVRLLRGDHRLALSGTPVENHLGELWSLFDFLNPGMLGSASVFRLGGIGARNPDPGTRELLGHAVRPFILRRTKEQVAKDLPQKLEQTVYCELEPAQRALYNELRDHYRDSLLARVARDGINKSKIHVLEALLRLRQAACHPGLIDRERTGDPCAKLDYLLPQIAEVIDEQHKVLVFSQFTSLLAIMRNRLDREGICYEYLDGKTRDRASRVMRFQNDSDCRLFLVSLKAGGLGLNLTAAEYVYLLDPWWNPAVEAQAIDRTHRIGQTRRVFAYRLIARDTVEEKVLELQETKRNLADAIINADNSLIRNLGREDLELLLS